MKNLFKDRKTLYVTLSIVVICVFSLTIAYAALNTVLKITGSAEVSSAEWDIRLENPIVTSGSVNNTLPTITSNKEASFSATLTNPGDFYEFTIDVVNKGSIDAMIGSIEKTPTLTEIQAKYLNYIVEYQNGEIINTKQLVSANSFVRLKVKVEFRKDLSSTDLPTKNDTLNLSFTVNYIQASEDGTTVPDNGKLVRVVNGDGTKTSDEVCIDTECFYVITSTDDTVTMLSKYNLHVGGIYDNENGGSILENPTGIQDESARAWFPNISAENPAIGTVSFSSSNYWASTVSEYPAYVYNENSLHYNYVESYKKYLEGLGLQIFNARLISLEELENLGCSVSNKTCIGAPNWVYLTTYWIGDAYSDENMWNVYSDGRFISDKYFFNARGVRPVVEISKDYF